MRKHRQYQFKNFMFDIVMTILTRGFWLIWVVIREVQFARQ